MAPGKRHLQTDAVKGAGHEHLKSNSFHLPPHLVSKGFCRAPSGESQAASRPAVSLGVAPDKDLATPIPREQNAGSGARRLPALQTCAIQHLPRRKEGGRLRQPRTRSSDITKRTPKLPRRLESASRSILPCPPHHPAEGHPAAGLGRMGNTGWLWKHFSHSLIKRGVIRPLTPSEEWIRTVCNGTVFSRSLSPKRRRERVSARQICFLRHNSFTSKVHLGESPPRNHWRCTSQEPDVHL